MEIPLNKNKTNGNTFELKKGRKHLQMLKSMEIPLKKKNMEIPLNPIFLYGNCFHDKYMVIPLTKKK